MIVVDATILSYYTIQGDKTEVVLEVRRIDPEWAAPPHWRSEFLNVLWTYMRRGDFGLDLAFLHFDTAVDLVALTRDVLPQTVLTLALQSNCTAYDCSYVALAQQLGVQLVTHDGPVLKAFPEIAIHPDDFVP
jgi:predicted nucleic acid-binding protein